MADDIVQRLRDKELLSIEEDGHTHFLPKNPDGDDGAAEIERLRAENEKLRAVLKEVSVCLDGNRTGEDLLFAVRAARRHIEGERK